MPAYVAYPLDREGEQVVARDRDYAPRRRCADGQAADAPPPAKRSARKRR